MRYSPSNQLYPAPVGELVYSAGRRRRFERCRREFLYTYVTARGGYDAAQPSEIRQLYLLKQLTGFDRWLDEIMRRGLRDTLEALPNPGNWRDLWLRKCRHRLYAGLRDMALEFWRDDPRGFLLLEEVYFDKIGLEELTELAENALDERCERLWGVYGERWQRTRPVDWVAWEEPLSAFFQDMTVYWAGGVCRRENGVFHWVQWSEGPPDAEPWIRYYAWRVLGVQPERLALEYYRPRSGAVEAAPLEGCNFSAAAAEALDCAAKMRDWLAECAGLSPELWRPEREGACALCRFREYCREREAEA